jgi:glycyl-tRNA synthetase beta chain
MAARLAKTDLTTELVKEFTELQGQVGGLYAKAQGFNEILVECLYWQYEPKNATSAIPPSAASQLLGLADRMNTIVDMFAIGNVPTGSKDPFSLRRSANGIVKILAEGQLPLGLSDVHSAAIGESKFAKAASTSDEVKAFFAERVDFYLREVRGQAYDVVKAVMAAGYDDVRDAIARAEAVSAARGSENFVAVCAAFKRMKNILAQAQASEFVIGGVSSSTDSHAAFSELHERARSVSEAFANLAAKRDYVGALRVLASLRAPIDAFFDQLMVMVDDEKIRAARLGLLQSIVQTFSTVADFSEIVVS